MKIAETSLFKKWRRHIKDLHLRYILGERINKIEEHNYFGDFKKIKDVKNLFELRIRYQQGYRIYYTLQGTTVVLLLIGGIKRSQTKDIAKAAEILKTLEKKNEKREN